LIHPPAGYASPTHGLTKVKNRVNERYSHNALALPSNFSGVISNYRRLAA